MSAVYTPNMRERRLTHNLSFRVDDDTLRRLTTLRDSFPNRQWGEALRWLLNQPAVEDLIATSDRVAADLSGIERSVPRGDR